MPRAPFKRFVGPGNRPSGRRIGQRKHPPNPDLKYHARAANAKTLAPSHPGRARPRPPASSFRWYTIGTRTGVPFCSPREGRRRAGGASSTLRNRPKRPWAGWSEGRAFVIRPRRTGPPPVKPRYPATRRASSAPESSNPRISSSLARSMPARPIPLWASTDTVQGHQNTSTLSDPSVHSAHPSRLLRCVPSTNSASLTPRASRQVPQTPTTPPRLVMPLSMTSTL